MTASIPAYCYTTGLFCVALAAWLLGDTIYKWRRHDEDALAAKLLGWILDEEGNPDTGAQPANAADGPGG